MGDSFFDPRGRDIASLGKALADGRVTSAGLVDAYLARISALDQTGSALRAMIALHPGARDEAARLDEERGRGAVRGPLHGIPMVVKDNIDVAGLPTTAGSVLWHDHVAPRDAAVVAMLRGAGALVLGKTNMSEFACSNGWYGYSSLGGLTLNPYNTARNAAGSSSGSAAAVAGDFAAFALGTDTFGSIRAPACVTGLVGLRPTVGLCPLEGILPLAPDFDVVGPMGRTVRDAALLLDVMTVETRSAAGYASSLDKQALHGARIGVAGDFPGEGEVADAMRAACAAMRTGGAEMIPVRLPRGADTVHADFLGPLADSQWDAALAAYFEGSGYRGPRDLVTLAHAAGSSELAGSDHPINPRTVVFLRHALAQARLITPARRLILHAARSAFGDAVRQLMRRERLDAIAYPSLSCPASPRYDRHDPAYACGADNFYLPLYVASAAGLPDVSVPAGMAAAGVPIGVSLMGWPNGEARLLSLAYAFEQISPARIQPPL
jgi:amidase